MRIAIAQLDPTVGDLDGNLAKALDAAEVAAGQGAGMIVYPAHVLTGAPLGGLGASEAFVADVRAHLEEFAERCPILALVSALSTVEVSDDGLDEDPDDEADALAAPVLFAVSGGELDPVAVPMLAEDDECPLLEIEGENVAVLHEDHFAPDLELAGVNVLVEMSADALGEQTAAPAATGRLERVFSLAATCHSFVVDVNLCGAADGMVFAGNSTVTVPGGQLVYACEVDAEEVYVFDTDVDRVPAPTFATDARLDPQEHLWRSLVMATRDYVRKNGFTDVVVGLSGGLDSSVVAAIAVDALGSDHVHGVLMPGPYSSEGSVTDARALAENLGVQTAEVPITQVLGSFEDVLSDACGGQVEGLARENLQARIRTVHLMTMANTYGWLLLNTGNKSEAAMGFSTLYGDTAGAYAPVGDVYKTDLYDLARWRMRRGPSIPEECIAKPPSAELYPGGVDADRLPPYELLDAILREHVEGGRCAAEIVEAGYDADLVRDVLRRVGASEYKRRSEPIAANVSPVPFTAGRDWPVTNAWVDNS